MERDYWKDSAFVTLTYEDEFLPPTLRPRHLQLFFKRLRKDLGDRKIKYFACGEYGDKGNVVQRGPFAGQFVHRPHYHAIVFGLSPVNDRHLVMENWPYADWNALESTARGRKAIGTVTYDSCRYTAGYVQKKLYGKRAKKEFAETGKVQPFVRMSKGLGLQFALDNKDLLSDSLTVGLRGYSVMLPHYYRDKLGVEPERMSEKHRELVKEDFALYLKNNAFKPTDLSESMFSYYEYGNPLAVENRRQREIDLLTKQRLYSPELEFDV